MKKEKGMKIEDIAATTPYVMGIVMILCLIVIGINLYMLCVRI